MGLAAYAFTANPSRARRTVAELRAGIVGIISRADGGVQLRVAVSFVQNVLDFPTDRTDPSLVVNGAEAHLA